MRESYHATVPLHNLRFFGAVCAVGYLAWHGHTRRQHYERLEGSGGVHEHRSGAFGHYKRPFRGCERGSERPARKPVRGPRSDPRAWGAERRGAQPVSAQGTAANNERMLSGRLARTCPNAADIITASATPMRVRIRARLRMKWRSISKP